MRLVLAGLGFVMLAAVSTGWADDSVTNRPSSEAARGNVKVVEDAPPVAQGNLFQTTEQAFGGVLSHEVNTQAQSAIEEQAAAVMD